GGREAEANIRQIRAHVVQEEVGVGEESLPVERTHGVLPRAKPREMAGSASDVSEKLLAPLGCFGPSQGRRRGQEPQEVVREIEGLLVDLGTGGGIDPRGNGVTPDRFLGGRGRIRDALLYDG